MRDPVCGKTLEENTPRIESVYLQCRYAFCSDACKQKFDTTPRDYLSDSSLGA